MEPLLKAPLIAINYFSLPITNYSNSLSLTFVDTNINYFP